MDVRTELDESHKNYSRACGDVKRLRVDLLTLCPLVSAPTSDSRGRQCGKCRDYSPQWTDCVLQWVGTYRAPLSRSMMCPSYK